jgi:hypothetical protein
MGNEDREGEPGEQKAEAEQSERALAIATEALSQIAERRTLRSPRWIAAEALRRIEQGPR